MRLYEKDKNEFMDNRALLFSIAVVEMGRAGD
jgi:hypothetical protein